jgi:hypothetical protein
MPVAGRGAGCAGLNSRRGRASRSGVLHGCRCLKPGVLLDTFTPQRKDYLPK